ncbi:hypothetical protein IL306_004115 [Fusarium sp. DS 682]|nr:hypothetical protein IL306_004115 [Fusarium sp. DS 682]
MHATYFTSTLSVIAGGFTLVSAYPKPLLSRPSHSTADSLLVGPSIVEVPPSFRNVFPAKDFNRAVTKPYWDTVINDTDSQSIANRSLEALRKAHFIAFEPEFYKVCKVHLGQHQHSRSSYLIIFQVLGIRDYKEPKEIKTIFDFPPGPEWANRLVHDGSVYAPECNCVFVAELHPPTKGYSMQFLPWVWRTNLNGSHPATEKVYPNPPLTIANGAYYHNGSIYWAQEGNYTTPGGIVKMNPQTLETEVVLNNFMGHRFNSPNDVVITKSGVAFFTDGYYGYDNFNDTVKPEMANGVWRWDITSGGVRMVAGAGTGVFVNPNGVALNAEEDKLFVTARGFTSADADGNRNIYEFDGIDKRATLAAPRLFTYDDAGFPDGVKVDADGRVYGGVAGAVDVWSRDGDLLGKIKVADDDTAVNMQFVGKTLYIHGRNRIYTVELSVRGA